MRRLCLRFLLAVALVASTACASSDVRGRQPEIEAEQIAPLPGVEADVPSGARLTARAEKAGLLPLEPLFFSGELANQGAEQVQVPGRWRDYVRLQVWVREKKVWRDIKRWWEPSVLLPPLPPVTLAPGEALRWEATWYTFTPKEQEIEPCFHEGETALVRAAFLSEKPKVVLASAPVTLRIGRLSADEGAAARALVEQKLVYALLPTGLGVERVPRAAQEVEAFIGQYPRTVYADYLRAFYGAQSRERSDFSREKAMSYRRTLEKESPWLLNERKKQP